MKDVIEFKKYLFLVLLLSLIFLISGCINQDKIIKGGEYYLIHSLNFSCNIPNQFINEVSNLEWKEENETIIHGSSCEAISSECTSEIYLFEFEDNSLRHRIHYFGNPDDIYYLIYNNKEYHCIKEIKN